MIRQAHTYLVSAMSGAGLIAVAIAVFVLLVSTQVFTDWPIAALGGKGKDSSAVFSAKPVGRAGGGGGGTVEAGGGGGGGAPAASTGQAGGGANGGNGGSSGGTGLQPSETPAGGEPSGNGGNGGGGGGQGGSGNGGGGGNGGSGSAGSSPQPASEPASSSGSGGGGKGTGGGGGSTPTTSASTTITETVNGTVNTVDETVLGGTLEKTGVTGATEEVVNGVAGPESPVGQVVDETVHTVEGLLHPPGH